MVSSEETVFVIEDDNSTRALVSALSRSVGLECQEFASAGDFLAHYDPLQPGCLVLDIVMPHIDGIALQHELLRRRATLPIIFVTGRTDVATAVAAMRHGAFDFLQKPIGAAVLTDTIQRALDLDRHNRRVLSQIDAIRQKLYSLTPREREVLEQIARGRPNKAIALDLSLSQRSVEFHRSHMMEKMGASSVAQLVRMLMNAQGG